MFVYLTMSLFKKPKKHIQRRVFGSNEDDETTENNGMEINADERMETQPITNVKKKERKDKDKAQPKQTLLSFGDEDEGEVFQVKKSSYSKKIMRLLDKERRKKKEEKVESEEVVKPKAEEKRTEIITGDLVMVVKNTETPRILNGRAALCAGRDDMSSDEEQDSGAARQSSGGHRFSHPDSVKIVLESGKIPDAAMIHAARKRRQRARELGDYVPVEEAAPEKDKGRLVREDDESDEERIDMTVNLTARDRDKRREQFFAAQDEESEPDTDKEMEEWENQQIRKGVTGAQLMAASQESNFSQYMTSAMSLATPKVEYTASTTVPDMISEPGVPRTPQAIADKLRERLTTVRGSYDRHRQELDRVRTELSSIDEELKQLELKAPRAAQRFRFYQELRGYVTDLVECLDEKVPVIAGLEQKALELLNRRAERLMERRRQDVRDQAEEVAMQAKPGMRRSGTDDEARVRRAAEREGRRSRRRRAREAPGHPKHIEGMSSDDEVPDQETLMFQTQKEQILLDVSEVFADVVDDFSSVGSILSHFEQWRETDMSAYMEAYASMCLPRIVSPLLRLGLVFWDPLTDTDDLDKYKWYSTLMLYGMQKNETEESLLTDPDVNLVPTVVEKIIVPKLTQLVEKCWDPMSSSQTLRLIGIVGRYVRRYPSLGPASKALNSLFTAVLDKLKSAVEHDVFIPIFSKQMLESKSPFFQRQFASGLKLLRNVTSWQGIINDQMLKDLALGALLNRYLLNGLRICQLTDAVSKAGLISHILPRIWLQSDLQQLQMFTNFVTQLAAQLDKDNPLHMESVETVASILKSLRCT